MKLISLNVWGGALYEPLMKFVKTQSKTTDIFCFQEVFDTKSDKKTYKKIHLNLLFELKNILKDFNCYFTPYMKGYAFFDKVDFDLSFGLATFVKKDYLVLENDNIFIFGEKIGFINNDKKRSSKKLQYNKLAQKNLNIFNVHGLWYPGEKLDTVERIEQSKKINNYINTKTGPNILCGDFNLYPETKSMIMLEKNMVNLIKEFDIQTTRPNNSQKYGRVQFFADYTLVSKDLKINSFEVPNIEVSDHLPMILDFD